MYRLPLHSTGLCPLRFPPRLLPKNGKRSKKRQIGNMVEATIDYEPTPEEKKKKKRNEGEEAGSRLMKGR